MSADCRQREIWWAEVEHKRRPVVVVTGSDAVPMLARVVAAPVTRSSPAPWPRWPTAEDVDARRCRCHRLWLGRVGDEMTVARPYRRRWVACVAWGALLATVVVGACDRSGTGRAEACRDAALAADPGRVVMVDGSQALELSGTLSYEGKGLEGATVQFVLHHDKPGTPGNNPLSIVAGERDTDSAGRVVYRQDLETLAHDVRNSGALRPDYWITWDSPNPVDGVQYCSGAQGEASLPVAQLPKP